MGGPRKYREPSWWEDHTEFERMSRSKSGEKNKGGQSRQRDTVSKVMKGWAGETVGRTGRWSTV